jgi:DNA-binding response OmpR family regulator
MGVAVPYLGSVMLARLAAFVDASMGRRLAVGMSTMLLAVLAMSTVFFVRAEKREKYTYILLLTVLEGKESYLEGMKAGTDDFITKPLDRDQLAARIRVAERILSLQTELKQLQGLLPICSYCS